MRSKMNIGDRVMLKSEAELLEMGTPPNQAKCYGGATKFARFPFSVEENAIYLTDNVLENSADIIPATWIAIIHHRVAVGQWWEDERDLLEIKGFDYNKIYFDRYQKANIAFGRDRNECSHSGFKRSIEHEGLRLHHQGYAPNPLAKEVWV
jgi:hypothetical protein